MDGISFQKESSLAKTIAMHTLIASDFPYIDFGDVRRNNRFISILNNISKQPGASVPKQNKKWYDTKATYQFFKNSNVTTEALQKTQMLYGSGQIGAQKQVLILQDITNISYNHLQAEGLGYLDNKEGRGILCYSSIAATTEGLPLALLYQHTWIRSLEDLGKSTMRKKNDFEEKESYRWYEGMKTVNELLDESIHKIHIADRGADIYELFFHSCEPYTDLLIRARHNRQLSNGHYIWNYLQKQPAAATITLKIPDKTGKKKRKIKAEIRYAETEVLRPANSKASEEKVTLTAIEVKEIGHLKKEEDKIHWKLLTTLKINQVSDALQCVKWYTCRWLIERFHYVLKSGTKVEELQLKEAQRLQKAIMVFSMAAFRIMQLVYESRHYPETSCEIALTQEQWITLYMLINKSRELPEQPPTLRQAIMWIGKLGGHLGRKSDGNPGLKTTWRGYQQLCHATEMYELLNNKNLGKA